MTEEEKNEMENHVRSLQEGFKLLSSEDLRQLEEEQNADDENMDKKVAQTLQMAHYLVHFAGCRTCFSKFALLHGCGNVY